MSVSLTGELASPWTCPRFHPGHGCLGLQQHPCPKALECEAWVVSQSSAEPKAAETAGPTCHPVAEVFRDPKVVLGTKMTTLSGLEKEECLFTPGTVLGLQGEGCPHTEERPLLLVQVHTVLRLAPGEGPLALVQSWGAAQQSWE